MNKTEGLQRYFNFTQNDLDENIQGRMTEKQRVMLREKIQKEIIMIVALFMILAVVALIIFPSNKLYSGVMIVAMVVTVTLRIIIKSNHSLDFVEGKVNFFWEEHRVRDAGDENTYTTTRKLKMEVDGRSFDVREELMDIIDQGDNCCFYLTGGGDFLSAEFLDKS